MEPNQHGAAQGGKHLAIRSDWGRISPDVPSVDVAACLPLSKVSCFALLSIDPEAGTLVWPNGVDSCPDVLYAEATGRDITEVGNELEEGLPGNRSGFTPGPTGMNGGET
ncbi:MAG TPA: DUF2442 domain-containing protein [Planctomycetes bacterium]|nr:DUF2442 domain-containing protein [Planctomycetota bacterium]